MVYRNLFRKIMDYGDFSRLPVIHWKGWPETRERWIREGMPPDQDEHSFFHALPRWRMIEINAGLYPAFTESVLEEDGTFRIYRDEEGVTQKRWARGSGMPEYLDHLFKTAAQWPEYRDRLQAHPDRIPHDLEDQIEKAESSGLPVALPMGSLVGWIRNWMGIENLTYLMADDPQVFGEIVDRIAALTCWCLDQVVPPMKRAPDLVVGWEDICYRNGPLIHPAMFEKYVAPGYARIRGKLDEYGIPFMAVDCDGLIDHLLPLWLEAGVNLHYPVEIGAWNTDPMALRKKFGPRLRMVGGIDKRALARGPAAIDEELEKRRPLMEEGGYLPMPDHLLPPDTPLAHYQYYLEKVRAFSRS